MQNLKSDVISYLKHLRNIPLSSRVRKIAIDNDMHKESIFSYSSKEEKTHLVSLLNEDRSVVLDRVVGSLVGLAVADALGHNFEFDPIRDTITMDKYFEYPATSPQAPARGVMHYPRNEFQLQHGQFTDDTSMALCLADSILTCGTLNGSVTRCWFWNWWNNGLNNSFRYDDTRWHSVGLGGNISRSVGNVSYLAKYGKPIPHHYEAQNEDAGNGSLMRLAPVALRYHMDIAEARRSAFDSSLTTHPGPIAAEACSFLSHLIVTAINRSDDTKNFTTKQFLQSCVNDYLEFLESSDPTPARMCLIKLLKGQEDDDSTERCWNWKDDSLMFGQTLMNRGYSYNGYPVSPGYFGSFSMDGLAIALHCIYHTDSFNAAVVKVVNFFGDADTTGAIVGQIAGAIYGASSIERAWIDDLRRWDPDNEIALRALLLYFAGLLEKENYFDNGTYTGDTNVVTKLKPKNGTHASTPVDEADITKDEAKSQCTVS